MRIHEFKGLFVLYAALIIKLCIFNDGYSSVDAKNGDQNDIQMSPLLLSYVAMCGYDYLCNLSSIPIPVYMNRSFKNLAFCPKCACEDECLNRGDCCPDLYFKFPLLACKTVDILTIDREATPPPTYMMSTTCPPGTDKELVEECTSTFNSSQADRLLLPPVTSTKSIPVTYLNQFCAECRADLDFISWDLDIECQEFADFNFLSTYQGIIDLAKNRSCEVTFNPSLNKVFLCKNEQEPGDVYFKCNMTGTWTDYNANIDMACSSLYGNRYGIFKNVFCFLCNPEGKGNDKVILQCNETGMWLKYDQDLEYACLNLPYVKVTKPFRNIFCLLCNIDDMTFTGYIDAKVEIEVSESIQRHEFTYIFRVQSFYFVFLLHELLKVHPDRSTPYRYEYNNDYLTQPDLLEQNINLTNLLLSTSVFNQKGFCYPEELVGYNEINIPLRSCSCFPMCSGECCTDFSLTYPVSCISKSVYNHELPWSDEYLVVDGCYNQKTIKIFKDLCAVFRRNSSNIFEFLPVHVDKATYSNIFCYLCNVEDVYEVSDVQTVLETKFSLQPLDLKIDCKYFLDYKHHIFLYDVIKAASTKCNIQLLSSFQDTIYCNEMRGYLVEDKCNATGSWPQMNLDVQWACEKTKPYRFPEVASVSGHRYKNEFCFMCNSDVSSIISSCNETGNWNIYDLYDEKRCLLESSSTSFYPYKNFYCWKCNSIVKMTTTTTTELTKWESRIIYPTTTPSLHKTFTPTKAPSIYDATFRSLFSLGQYNKHRIIPKITQSCFDDQVYDEVRNDCRNTTCFPGKLLHADECKPLLIVTKNLRYVLAFILTGSDLPDPSVGALAYMTFKSVISSLLSQLYIDRDDIDIEEIHVMVNKPCSSYLHSDDFTELVISVYVKIFIKSLVSRLQTENKLLEYMSGQLNISSNTGKTSEMDVRISTDALMMPLYLNGSVNYRNDCLMSISVDEYSVEKQEQYRTAYVLDILLCKQIQFSSEEYMLDETGLTLEILPLRVSLRYDEFQIMSDKTVRVCLDRVLKYMTGKNIIDKKQFSPLVLVTRVCLAISLVFLFLTFLTFSLLPELRTLPGKNNMALMFALFFAQLSFFIIDQADSKTLECKIIGILAHYFWLCVFGNFNTCSFHMYRVFSGGFTNIQWLTDVNKVVLKMALFAFGLPALIVTAHITVTVVVTQGQSIGYGENKCFITYKEAFIATLLVPMAFMSLCSLICFSFTAYVIKSRPKVKKSKTDQLEFLVYLKLFVVTGSTWIIQVVDTFLPMSFLTYVIAVLNGLQGLFIFLSYVFKKRVIELFKRRVFKSQTGGNSVTLSTNSESVHQQSGSGTENSRI